MREIRMSGSEGGGANSSPYPYTPAQGCTFATLGAFINFEDPTLKELRRCANRKTLATPFRVAKNLSRRFLPQGFKANPGLKLANAFSVRLKKLAVTTIFTPLVLRP
jgi:hypothetical protein